MGGAREEVGDDGRGAALGLAPVSGARPWALALVSAARPANEDEDPTPASAPSPARRLRGGGMRLVLSVMDVLVLSMVVLDVPVWSEVVVVALAEDTGGCCGCSGNGDNVISNDDDVRARLLPVPVPLSLLRLPPVGGGVARVRVGRVGTEVGCTEGCTSSVEGWMMG